MTLQTTSISISVYAIYEYLWTHHVTRDMRASLIDEGIHASSRIEVVTNFAALNQGIERWIFVNLGTSECKT